MCKDEKKEGKVYLVYSNYIQRIYIYIYIHMYHIALHIDEQQRWNGKTFKKLSWHRGPLGIHQSFIQVVTSKVSHEPLKVHSGINDHIAGWKITIF